MPKLTARELAQLWAPIISILALVLGPVPVRSDSITQRVVEKWAEPSVPALVPGEAGTPGPAVR